MGLFNKDAQLHGAIILQLKQKYPCAQHQGENGDTGHCYIRPNREHTSLNSCRLEIWASAIVSVYLPLFIMPKVNLCMQAAADATKHKPPNSVEFDGSRDGRLTASKHRGCSGPHMQAAATPAPAADSANAVLMAALLPIIMNLSGKRQRSPSPRRPAVIATPPHTPSHLSITSTMPMSPLLGRGSELRACLSDFAEALGIDITDRKAPLMELELTSDIIPDVPAARLCDITGVIEGRIHKFQVYCRTWNVRLDAKHTQLSDKRRRLDYQ